MTPTSPGQDSSLSQNPLGLPLKNLNTINFFAERRHETNTFKNFTFVQTGIP